MSPIKKITAFTFWIAFIIIIILIAIYLMLIANGYKVNYKTWHVAKTGMIYLKSEPNDVSVFLNGKLVSDKTSYRANGLWPGRYDIKVTKDGYQDWQKTFIVEGGLTSSQDYIKLFLSEPKVMGVSTDEQDHFSELTKQWPAKGLEIKQENEIWFNDVFTTRFSLPVRSLGWYNDLKHLLFQIDKEIRVMEVDGSNNIKLISLDSDTPTQFISVDNGGSLLYKDGEEIKKMKIR